MNALAPIVHVEPATVEPTRPLWLRLVAWWPSLLFAVVAVSLVVGASRCWA